MIVKYRACYKVKGRKIRKNIEREISLVGCDTLYNMWLLIVNDSIKQVYPDELLDSIQLISCES